MSVTAHDGRTEVTGDGSTDNTGTGFQFYDDGDLIVTMRAITAGTDETWVLDTDYTVTGGSGSTGTVTLKSPARTAAVDWTMDDMMIITRAEPLGQSFNTGAQFSTLDSQSVLEHINRIYMALQMLSERIDRCLTIPLGDPLESQPVVVELPDVVDRASEALSFDASGDVTTS